MIIYIYNKTQRSKTGNIINTQLLEKAKKIPIWFRLGSLSQAVA